MKKKLRRAATKNISLNFITFLLYKLHYDVQKLYCDVWSLDLNIGDLYIQ